MAETSPASLDKWRDYFRTANSDIFGIIEHAIMVAALDCPFDFKSKRDRIAQVLFACKITKCVGCDKLELSVPPNDDFDKSEDKYKSGIETGGSKDTKESKVNSSNRDGDDEADDGNGNRREVMEMNVNHVSNDGYGDLEALNDEIEEESQFFGEVLRIKEILDNHDESDALLIDSLIRLQLMSLSVETLKVTEIGKSVNALRKHGSKEIRNLVRALIENWTIMVDSWVDATNAIAGAEIRTESVKTSVMEEEEEGLPSPPLDEGAFLATPTSMELSQFFDGMDDDGNPREFNKNREDGRKKPNVEKTEPFKLKNESLENSRSSSKPEQKRNPESVLKKQTSSKPNKPLSSVRVESVPPKPSNYESGPGRPKPAVKPKVQQKPDEAAFLKKPMPPRQEKLNFNNESSDRIKLEAAKRKLQERYQEAEKAKKQRTIQVVELHDLPKQSVVVQRNRQMRPGNHIRNRANGRL